METLWPDCSLCILHIARNRVVSLERLVSMQPYIRSFNFYVIFKLFLFQRNDTSIKSGRGYFSILLNAALLWNTITHHYALEVYAKCTNTHTHKHSRNIACTDLCANPLSLPVTTAAFLTSLSFQLLFYTV